MESSAQFNLRWNNHSFNILQVFLEQLSSENLVDVTLSCEGQFLKAHKMVLSACSPYFQDLFNIHQIQHPVIILNGVKFSDLKTVVDFMYRGETRIFASDLNGILSVAESLQIKGLSNVRPKYEKGQIQGSYSPDTSLPVDSVSQECDTEFSYPDPILDPLETLEENLSSRPPRKRKRMSEVRKKVSQTSSLDTSRPETPQVDSSNSGKDMEKENSSSSASEMLPPKHFGAGPPSPRTSLTPESPSKEHTSIPSHRTYSKYSKSNLSSTSPHKEQDHNTEVLPCVQVALKEPADDDIDLSPMIKVEPLFIRDIDDNDASWDDPMRLVIDLQSEEESQKKDPKTKIANCKPRPASKKQKLRVRPASELSSLEESLDDHAGICMQLKDRSKEEKIPRPPNAFMIFANEWRRKLALENPSESNKQISVRLGMKWKALATEKKEWYFSLSKQADEEHKRKYPHYIYNPKEARLRKSQKLALRNRVRNQFIPRIVNNEGSRLINDSKDVNVVGKNSENNDACMSTENLIVKEELNDEESNAHNLEVEFMKMVEDGQVEAEVEEDPLDCHSVHESLETTEDVPKNSEN